MPRLHCHQLIGQYRLLLFLAVGFTVGALLPGRFWENVQPSASAASTFTVTNTNNSGPGSFRQAILDANTNPGADTIGFSIGSGTQKIVLATVLPVVTDPVTIDAWTQPGFASSPLIELSGDGAMIGDGISITAGNSTVRGFVINNIRGHAIKLESGGGNVIEGNYIGTDVTGSVRVGNNQNGVFILSSNNNRIGGTIPASRNVISGSGGNGVHLALGASGNLIQGNYIGTNAAGTASLAIISSNGIVIFNNSSNNTIGGTVPGARNIISGNSDGIQLHPDSSNTIIQGNYIGTDVTGTISLPNTTGIRLAGANNIIGGITATPGTPPGNLISGNTGWNIDLSGRGAVVQGNIIGIDGTGTKTLTVPSSASLRTTWCIDIGGSNALIGGTPVGARNIISGCGAGISLGNTGEATIQGNYIGTDINGSSRFENTGVGIHVSTNPTGTVIGGNTAAARNVISGNFTGIEITFGGAKVQGNFIGTDATGTAALPNSGHGVSISGGINNAIGGTGAGEGNTIAFNGNSGVAVLSSVTKNSIRANSIFSNNLLGIDLGDNGVTFNDAGDGDTGPNNYQNHPLVTSVSTGGGTTTIQGTLNSAASSNFNLDFYVSNSCDPSGFGEGTDFIGTTATATDASGNASFNASFPVNLSTGQFITATATDASGNTSEFSICYGVGVPGTVQFTNSSYAVNEANGSVTVWVTRTLGTAAGASVDYATADGTAQAGMDYTAVSGTLVFAPGETAKSFTVPILNDSLREGQETISISLSNPTSGVTLGSRSTSVINIVDNDPLPGLSINDVSVNEGDSGTTDATFTVSLSVASGQTVTVNARTGLGTAASVLDYQVINGQLLTFAPGETSKTVTVKIVGDLIDEPSENFLVVLTSPTNATITDSQGVATILDNDPPPAISINDVSIAEGSSGTTNFVFTVSLSAPSSFAVTVNFATADATAQTPFDYQSVTGSLTFNPGTFAPGETQKTITIPVAGDTANEPDETFTINLTNAQNGTLARAQGTGTILNDDASEVTLSSDTYSFNEAEPTGAALITVNRSGDLNTTVTVNYTSSDNSGLTPCQTNTNGVASDRCDYATAAGTLRFAAGEASKQIQIPIINDAYVEPAESFNITLSNAQGASLGTSSATVTITDNDTQGATQNPINDQEFFIRQQYIDFLGRVAEPAGLQFWMNRMNNCPAGQVCDRTDTAKRFFESDEFKERGYYVYKLYDAVLGRQPQYGEFVPDVARLNGPQTPAEQRLGKDAYLQDLINKAEFRAIYGQFLNAAGTQVLNAAAATGFVNELSARAGITPASKQTLINNLAAGTRTPAQTIEDFILTPEINDVGTFYYDRAIITMQYFGFLRRNPDTGGFNFWWNRVATAGSPQYHDYRELVNNFLRSDEYNFRFAFIPAP
jgi:hypothetical protein